MAAFLLHRTRVALAAVVGFGLALPVASTTLPVATASATSTAHKHHNHKHKHHQQKPHTSAVSISLDAPAARTPSSTVVPPGGCPDAHLTPTAANLAAVAAATLCLVNQERQQRGIAPLAPSPALAAAAARYSRDMVARDYFAHVSPTGVNLLARVRRAGYMDSISGYNIAENIAAATGSRATPAGAVRLWMRSAGHRANLLDASFRDTGIGVAVGVPALVGTSRGATYTEDFGTTS